MSNSVNFSLKYEVWRQECLKGWLKGAAAGWEGWLGRPDSALIKTTV